MKIYTIRDIAREAGVSVTTVSRVLNHRPDVKDDTRRKVESVMAARHFVGNANARGLKQTDGDVAAIILRGQQNPFLNALAEAMLQYTKNARVTFLTEFIDEKADEFQAALRLSRERRAGGFIFVGSRIDDRSKALAGLDAPIVFATAGAETARLPGAASVVIDDRAMGRLAAATLLERGHRRIAVFGGRRELGDSLSLRWQGVLDAFRDAGVPFDESRYVENPLFLKGAYDCTRAYFAVKSDTTAVFAMSDTVAMGVIRALNDIGRRVPEDVSVFGFDGIEMGQYLTPRLTTIEQPVGEIAQASVEVLLDMLGHGAPPRHVVLDAVLRLRESVR